MENSVSEDERMYKSIQEPPPTTESSGSRRGPLLQGSDGEACFDDLLACAPTVDESIWEDIKTEVLRLWYDVCCLAKNTCCSYGDEDNATVGPRG